MVMLLLGLACSTGQPADSKGDSGGARPDTADTGDSDGNTGDPDTGGGETGDSAPPADIDADGYVALADGGEDCDDLDPTRHPGATEHCDGKDHDCDGEANEGTRCSDLLVPDEMLAARIDGSALAIVDDVTGDGLADIGIWGAVDYSGAGSAYAVIFAEGTLPGVAPHTDVYSLPGVRARWTEPYGDAGTYVDASGDIDGDGLNDLAIVSGVGYGDGGIPILFGPFAVGDIYDLGEATEAWRPTDVDPEALRWTQWGAFRRKGDFNDDGLMDNLEVGGDWNHVFFGGEYSVGDTTEAMSFRGCYDGDAGVDVDGDGVADFVVLTEGEGEVLLVSGVDVLVSEVSISEFAQLRVSPAAEGGALSHLGTPVLMTDLDGDGFGELLIAAHDARSSCGDECEESLFFSGEQRGSSDGFEARGSYVSSPSADFTLVSPANGLDFDGDGRGDLVLYTKDAEGANEACLLPGRLGVPGAPAVDLPSHRLCVEYGDSVNLGPGADTNGDGYGDVVVTWDSDPSGGHHYVADLLLGFDVPWDDPSYW